MENYNDIKDRSARSVKWVGIAELFIRGIQFVTSLLLARLLVPEDFGVMSLVFVFINLAYVVFDFGFTSALIQKKEVSERHFSTTFVAYVVSAGVFIVAVFLSAPFLAEFFKVPSLRPMLRVLAFIFGFYTLSALPKVMLMRDLHFHRLSRFQMAGSIGYAIVAISIAWMKGGAWCFIFAALTEQFIITLLVINASGWRPSFDFDWQAFKELFHFGGNVLATRIAGYLNTNIPQIIIGRMLGTATLGFYTLAYQLIDFPVQRISKNILKVMFPAFSRLQDSPREYQEMYQQTIYFLALITFPIFIALFLLAPDLVPFLYGEKWLPAVFPLQVLSGLGLIRSLWTTASVVFLSKGKPQIELRLQLALLIVLAPALYWASTRGFTVLLMALLVCYAGLLLGGFVQAMKLVEFPLKKLGRILSLPALASGVFWIIGEGVRQIPLLSGHQLITMVSIAVLGGGVYVFLTFRTDKSLYRKIGKFIAA